MNELTLTHLLLDSLTSQHLCTESYTDVFFLSIRPVKGYMNELVLTRLLLDSLTSQHLCTESYIDVII